MSQVHYGRGYVYTIQYHLAWCVKYRHNILQGNIPELFIKYFFNRFIGS